MLVSLQYQKYTLKTFGVLETACHSEAHLTKEELGSLYEQRSHKQRRGQNSNFIHRR